MERVHPLQTLVGAIEGCLSEYNRYWKQSKDREKRAAIRQIRNACVADGHPDVQFVFKMGSMASIEMEFHNWGQLVVYELFKKTLGDGVAYHIRVCLNLNLNLKMNDLLSSVFKQNIYENQSLQETRKTQKIVSEMKRTFIKQ